jgi:nitronate monooxygenase
LVKTRITELFGIEYPVIGGGMLWLSRAELVAAISNAGGLGIISSASFDSSSELRDELQKTKDLTDKPFAVNIPFIPSIRDINYEEIIQTVVDEGIRIVETAGRSPEPYMPQFKEAEVRVLHKTPGVRYARTAERVGVDAVAILGHEAAGHIGLDDVTNFVLIRRAAQELMVPVVAAGAISDASSFVAALALGAEGVIVGTAFMMAKECLVNDRIKEWMVEAKENDTMLIQKSIRNTARVLKNPPAEKALGMENEGASLEELIPVISGLKEKELMETGNREAGILHCGQVVGAIDSVKTVKEIIEEMVSGAQPICDRLKELGVFNE